MPLPQDARSPHRQQRWLECVRTYDPYSLAMISGADRPEDGQTPDGGRTRLTLAAPTKTHQRDRIVAVGPDSNICTMDWPAYVLYDESDGTPANGEIWGAASGGTKLRKHKWGFVVLGDPSADMQAHNIVRVAPAPVVTQYLGTAASDFCGLDPTLSGTLTPFEMCMTAAHLAAIGSMTINNSLGLAGRAGDKLYIKHDLCLDRLELVQVQHHPHYLLNDIDYSQGNCKIIGDFTEVWAQDCNRTKNEDVLLLSWIGVIDGWQINQTSLGCYAQVHTKNICAFEEGAGSWGNAATYQEQAVTVDVYQSGLWIKGTEIVLYVPCIGDQDEVPYIEGVDCVQS